MTSPRIAAAVVMLLSLAGIASATPVTYYYTGNNFLPVFSPNLPTTPPYSSADSLSGSITLAGPLAPDGYVNTADILTYSFFDGINTWNPTDSSNGSFFVGLTFGSQGNAINWYITDANTNGYFASSDNWNNPGGGDTAALYGPGRGINYNPGTWSVGTTTTIQGGPSSNPDPFWCNGGTDLFLGILVPCDTQIEGTIGVQGSEDYYSFYWPGGRFSATALINGTPNAGASYLFSEGVTGTCGSGGQTTLNGSDGFAGTIANSNLAAGIYCIGLDANNSNDPGFDIIFNTPVDGMPASPVPEPGTITLLISGLSGLGLLTGKRRP